MNLVTTTAIYALVAQYDLRKVFRCLDGLEWKVSAIFSMEFMARHRCRYPLVRATFVRWHRYAEGSRREKCFTSRSIDTP